MPVLLRQRKGKIAMRKRTHKKHRAGGAILTLLCASAAVWGAFNLLSGEQSPPGDLKGLEAAPPYAEDHKIMPGHETALDSPTKEYRVARDLPVNSSNVILIQAGNGGVLFEKNSAEKIYPASLSKIMTAIVALENLSDLSESILLNEEIYSGLHTENASVAGFTAGESVRAIDLLYGLMLPSGAECGIALADRVAGSESAFVGLMNGKARELGMNDTHFANTSGLHDVGHYSTAEDIAALLQYAIKNDIFYKIFTSARHSTPPTNKHENGLTFYSTLFSNIDNADFDGGSILGGKTGYTGEAGRCLASLAEKYGERFILVTCGAPGAEQPQGAPGAGRALGAPGGSSRGLQDDGWAQRLHIADAFAVYAAIAETAP
jgi:D-alanyl-D-alanine carboxypeptidase (penicillin-binding protein 5/6)